ncbi:right-handed parallel beta-helix repeat-containing protein [Streptomyces virginiae]|uniref:right-handed parallel beta-helix repeat-containing protein n=1 Tax=Streptomyces virginiae TaxID=1961 RepID=UPI002DD9284B|nr:right-handed parallel beta-helix repeat-containing protein [Streptomyces virginiae]WSC78368.1 right-handed parallel beta-helix repeat-containing protein [Streptomyces virginiae]
MVARYVVSPNGGRRAHRDITSALAEAARRGRPVLIEIEPGHYEETLTVRGETRLVAVGGPGSVVVTRPCGAVLDSSAPVVVQGLVLHGRGADVVSCHAGALTLEHTEIRAHDGVAVHARPGTSLTLRDSTVLHGRVLLAGADGLVERCRFTDAADNALAVIDGGRLSLTGSRIEGSRLHGLRVSGGSARIERCVLTRTGMAAVFADARAELTVIDCLVESVQAEGIAYVEQSRGSVERTRVVDAQYGIAVASGADPLVRDCVLTGCRDTGLDINNGGRGRFENCEITRAGNVAVLVTRSGAPEVHDCRVADGKVAIAVTDGGCGRFTRIDIRDLTSAALRVHDEATAVFEHITVERCPSGLETRGNGGTQAELTDSVLRDVDMAAVTALGQTWVTLRRVTVQRAALAFGAGEEAQLLLEDCRAAAVTTGGASAFGSARLLARNLTVTGSDGLGVFARDTARLEIVDATLVDCAVSGASFVDDSGGRLEGCSVTGTGQLGALHNGLVDLAGLSTSLPVLEKAVRTEPGPTVVHHHYEGPVFNGPAHDVQLAWRNIHAVQHRTTNEDGRRT